MRKLGSMLPPVCLGAAATVEPTYGDAAVYPMLREGGIAYVISVDKRDRINKCEPADPLTDPAMVGPACNKIIARGVPAGIIPARPSVDPLSWIGWNDYPPDKFDRNLKWKILFEVDEQGRVSDCLIYRGSGDVTVDKIACAQYVQRGRFKPAMYKGKPVRAAGTREFRLE